jgi:hypothetical protein
MRKPILAAMLLATAACAGPNAEPQPAPPPPAAAHGYDIPAGRAQTARSPFRFQGNGAHTGTKASFERYARLNDRARAVPAAAAAIPADIQPDQPERV